MSVIYTELMPGDLLRTIETTKHPDIQTVRVEMASKYEVIADGLHWSASELEYIKLSDSLFTINGFANSDQPSSYTRCIETEQGAIFIDVCRCGNVWELDISRVTDTVKHLITIPIRYLHELQQAIRLVKLPEVSNSFKDDLNITPNINDSYKGFKFYD